MKSFFAFALCALPCLALQAELYNADMEFQPGAKFSTNEGWSFGKGGGWADHAGFPAPNNETLGINFGFYSQQLDQIMAQESSWVFQPETTYVFRSWATAGGGGTETIPYQIGYLDGGTDLNLNYIDLATDYHTVSGGGAWALQPGVKYTTGDTGPELGRSIVVRFGGVNQGGAGSGGGAWVDNAELIPEPTTIGLLGLGALAFLRRRR